MNWLDKGERNMLTEQDRAWARNWKRTPDELEEMRQKMKSAEEWHGRLFYRKSIDEFDDDEVKCYYIDMLNTLSDMHRELW